MRLTKQNNKVVFGVLCSDHLDCGFVTLRTRTHVTVWLVDWVLVIASHCFQADVPDMVSIFDEVYSLQYSVLMPIVNKKQL